MNKNLKKNLKKGISLIRYGAALKINLIFFVIMSVAGVVAEVMAFRVRINGGFMVFDIGAVFLLCAANIPGQMTLSVDLSALAQTSPIKKNIQTTMMTQMNLAFSLAAMTRIVVIRLITCTVTGTGLAEGFGDLWYTAGIVEFALLIFFAVCYKYFIASMAGMYFVLLLVGGGIGCAVGAGVLKLSMLHPHPLVSVLISYVLLLAGAGLGNLFSRLLYKKNLSKIAFGASVQRMK